MLSLLRMLASSLLRLLRVICWLANALVAQVQRSGGWSHLRRGFMLREQGLYRDALKDFSHALSLFQKIKDHKNEGIALTHIGSLYYHLGQYSNALDNYQQVLPLHRQVKNRKMEGLIVNNIGIVYYFFGQYSEALQYFHHSLIIRREIGDKSGEATTLTNIGLIYKNLGQNQKALENIKKHWKLPRNKIIEVLKQAFLII
ncbi:tetratricopeptide repeat protein [Chlorogloeopsis sp. ULAP01]|uniref:tetratricopeptide repeat protein n=1 Tax=Chlorogloeopsis sp. ULAP01 TaxID=3056483 RepID=UPI0025AAB8A9|nr:tetratricopeptide repeat protein [Chlorogloeopsis sp. ULAP01]MDM9385458.1 tetratricopeptide repeat protein [Chlorogloeopsis sp. ULAP01]